MEWKVKDRQSFVSHYNHLHFIKLYWLHSINLSCWLEESYFIIWCVSFDLDIFSTRDVRTKDSQPPADNSTHTHTHNAEKNLQDFRLVYSFGFSAIQINQILSSDLLHGEKEKKHQQHCATSSFCLILDSFWVTLFTMKFLCS